MIGLALLSILLVAASAALIVRGLSMQRVRTARVLEQIGTYGFNDDVVAPGDPGAVRGPVEAIGGLVVGRLGTERVASLRRMLIGAGLHRTTVERYVGLMLLSAIVVPLVFVWFAISTAANPALAFTEIVVGLMVGCLAPHGFVARRARLRMDAVDREIPELVDLLLVAVEGGLAFNGAIRL